MSDYIPTMQEVRNAYAYNMAYPDIGHAQFNDWYLQEMDGAYMAGFNTGVKAKEQE